MPSPAVPAFLLVATLIASLLGGCGALGKAPGLAAGVKRTQRVAARGVAPEPSLDAEFRVQLDERGFRKLRGALPWKEQGPRTDFYYDLFDGQTFRFRAAPEPLQVRIKHKGAVGPDGKPKIEWQVSRALERRPLIAGGLPFTLNVTRSWSDESESAAVETLLDRTDDFFLWLDDGGEPLRKRGLAVDAAWQGLSWPGNDLISPVTAAEPLPLVPTLMKRHFAMKADVPLAAGGALALHLAMDEVRDANGRWIDLFEIEAEADPPVPPEQLAALSDEFASALAGAGLTPDDLGPAKPDGALYTLKQLTLPSGLGSLGADPKIQRLATRDRRD